MRYMQFYVRLILVEDTLQLWSFLELTSAQKSWPDKMSFENSGLNRTETGCFDTAKNIN